MTNLNPDIVKILEAGEIAWVKTEPYFGRQIIPDLLCAIAMGSYRYGYMAAPVSSDNAAAMHALKWLAANSTGHEVSLVFNPADTTNSGPWECSINCGSDKYIIAEASNPCLAIARAVILVGLQERPKEMQIGWRRLHNSSVS